MRSITRLLFLLVMPTLISIGVCAQAENNAKKLIGTWLTVKVEPLKPMTDSLHFFEETKDVVITFKEGNKVNTKKLQDSLNQQVESGSYKLSPDEKKIIQESSEGIIRKITDDELVVEVKNEFVLYFKRIKATNK